MQMLPTRGPLSAHDAPASASPLGPAFQVLSDLHLELAQQYATYEIPATAPYLILAGDVGCLSDYEAYRAFLQSLVPNFKKVLLVLGNHEFYGSTYDEAIMKAETLCKEPSLLSKIVLLHRQTYDVPDSDITILGCTLWSHIPESSEVAVVGKVKDYRMIKDWDVGWHNKAHITDLEWLRNRIGDLKDRSDRRILAVTHHAPLMRGTSKPEHQFNPWTCAFATDIVDREEFSAINTWVFGHTHYTTDFVNNDIRIMSNQRGYVLPNSKEKRTSGFDVRKYIQLSPTR